MGYFERNNLQNNAFMKDWLSRKKNRSLPVPKKPNLASLGMYETPEEEHLIKDQDFFDLMGPINGPQYKEFLTRVKLTGDHLQKKYL